MKIFTIGFTKKSAEAFFTLLDRPDVVRVVDIRLKPNSQLAGFARGANLPFLLRRIIGKDYVHVPALAPSPDMLRQYREDAADWPAYERDFLQLMKARQVENTVPVAIIDGGCLLCSEAHPSYCHRRLVAEYFAHRFNELTIEHLVA